MAKKRKAQNLNPQDILALFRQKSKPLSRAEILRALRAQKRQKEELRHILQQLEDQGKIIHLRGGAFGLAERLKLVTGKLEVQRSGVGFVICDDKRRKDIFINPGNMGDAWHGDRVALAVLPQRGGKRAEGRIVRVIERGRNTLSARVLRVMGSSVLCQPTDPKFSIRLLVDWEDKTPPEHGEVLVVSPGELVEKGIYAAEILDRLGDEENIDAQEALVKMNNDVPTVFPQQVLQEAQLLPKVPSDDDFANREDLRDAGFVTIDGAMAKDFDDAILVEKTPNGYTLWVAIADVAHYVRAGSALDDEARSRGNSFYFPRSVEPMFPEALSNGLCSLNPDVPRLTMAVEMRFTKDGQPQGTPRMMQAVIRSKARLTYAQVHRAIILKDPEERANIPDQLEMLENAEQLARKLHDLRLQRGTIDFDLPEPEIRFNLRGETVDISPRVRNFAHQLIEEFMIAANEAVAEFLTQRQMPVLYRVHSEPDADKLRALIELLARTDLAESVSGLLTGGKTKTVSATPKDLQDMLAKAEESDMSFMVNRLLLRCMMQAKYTPANIGHFGLASTCYCHFTSPIRRYADLIVHRVLKQALQPETGPLYSPKNLKTIGEHLSDQERSAMSAEREILKRVTVLFLRDKIGASYTGVINGMADFGFWVELNEVMAEGLIRLSTLSDDYYTYVQERQELWGERTGKRFRLGQKVNVVLTDVNLSRLEVTLSLEESPIEIPEDIPPKTPEKVTKRKRKSKSKGKSKTKESDGAKEETDEETPEIGPIFGLKK